MAASTRALNQAPAVDVAVAIADVTLHHVVPLVMVESIVFGIVCRSLGRKNLMEFARYGLCSPTVVHLYCVVSRTSRSAFYVA
jgi:hypothetical protein